MRNLLEELTECLSHDNRLVTHGQLLENKVLELSIRHDQALLEQLVGHERLKQHFFRQVGPALVFDQPKFAMFIRQKAFMPDNFTAFSNKIGLAHHDDFLIANQHVVLSWPYKDCYLEGGQTKEDRKNPERFWNAVLAPEQIDRLLHPKCFTGFKRFTPNGATLPERLSASDNFLIRGNNLLAMHSLKPVFAGQIKLIYIDPPYNTGSDGFLYNDSFSHATWLTFMKNRLEVAWQLLAPKGCIFIQIDDTEFAYLKVLCDEIFGRECFREDIILKSSTESGVNAINVKRGERLFKVKEHILFYAKSSQFRFKPFYTKAAYNTNYKYEVVKVGERYTITDLPQNLLEQQLNGRKKQAMSKAERYAAQQAFIDQALSHPENMYSLEKNIKKAGEKFKQFAAANKAKGVVEEFVNSSGETVLVYDGGVLVPLKERIIHEQGNNYFGVLASDLWVDIGTTPASEGGVQFSNGKKPEKLLKRIIEMATSPGDWVLDYHLGSGTTAAVAHKLGRRYIGIEQMDYGEHDSLQRLQHVIAGDPTGISKTIGWQGGGSFVYMELKKHNQQLLEAIQSAKHPSEISALTSRILSHGFITHELDTLAWQQHQQLFAQLPLAEQQACLAALLDMNFLYVPFTEMEDTTYSIQAAEQLLNRQFYSLSPANHATQV